MLPSDRWIRLLIAPALVFMATAIDRNYQTDLWHHVARGRVIATEGRLLDEDRFSCTVAGKPLRDCNWAWQLANYRLYELGGLALVQTVNSGTLALMMAVLVAVCRRRSGSLAAAVGVCVLAFFGLWQMLIIRPQTLSLLLFVVLYACLDRALTRPRWLLAAPPILALWANVHGGFPVGLVLVGCYTAAVIFSPLSPWGRGVGGEGAGVMRESHPSPPTPLPGGERGGRKATLPWALCLTGCVAATLLNPYGWHVYQYVLQTSRVASGRPIDEWLPPGLHLLAGKVWVASVLLLIGLSAWARRKSAPDRRGVWRDLFLVCCFLPAACGSVRMVAWWLLVSAPLLAERLADLWPQLRREDPAINQPTPGAALTVGGLLAAMILSLPWLERFHPVFTLPGRAHRVEGDLQAVADRLGADRPSGRIFTRFSWGEYLGWALAGRYTVFMDGRIEIFPDDVWAQYSAVVRGRADWEEVLAGYGVDWLLLDSTGYHHELLPLVERSPNWRRVCQEGGAILFTHIPPSSPPPSP
jgi:hypothetical protein